MLADNFAENKCNTVFAWCTCLVLAGWFDEVELLFGPVGHTHNGNDSVHYVHNHCAGNFNSVTLAEYLNTFVFAWEEDDTRPQPVLLDVLYDWDSYFKKHINKVQGFTNTRSPRCMCGLLALSMVGLDLSRCMSKGPQ